MNFIRACILFWLSATLAMAQESGVPSHPMDALTPTEITRVVQILSDAGYASKATRYPAITLQEMPKAEVLAWTPGAPLQRKAFVISRESGETSESILDIDAGKVLSHALISGAEPMIMDAEWARARDRFMADPRFLKALERRGYPPKNSVFCTPSSAGYFPGEAVENRRILKVPCYDNAEKLHPLLAAPSKA